MARKSKPKALTPHEAADICLNVDDLCPSTKFQLWDNELGVEVFDTAVSRDLISICMVIVPVYSPLDIRTFGCHVKIDRTETQIQSPQCRKDNYSDAHEWLVKQFKELCTGVSGATCSIYQSEKL